MIRNSTIIEKNWGSPIVGKMVESRLRNENLYRSTSKRADQIDDSPIVGGRWRYVKRVDQIDDIQILEG
jgi:hypothetical protein